MKDNIERAAWARYLSEFNKRNNLRPTWLQIFGEAGAQSEEQGLPLTGICLEEKFGASPSVQIMLGRDGVVDGHMTHAIADLESMTPRVGTDGRDDAIEFIDKRGEASLLIFRHRARMATHA